MTTKKSTTTSGPSRQTIARRRNAAERRKRVLAEGGRRVELLLLPDAARALERLERLTGDSALAIITGLLLEADARRRSRKPPPGVH